MLPNLSGMEVAEINAPKKKRKQNSIAEIINDLLNVMTEWSERANGDRKIAVYSPYVRTPEDVENDARTFGGPYDTLLEEIDEIRESDMNALAKKIKEHPHTGASDAVKGLLTAPSRELMEQILRG